MRCCCSVVGILGCPPLVFKVHVLSGPIGAPEKRRSFILLLLVYSFFNGFWCMYTACHLRFLLRHLVVYNVN